ncbi:MAG: ribonuclease D [Clostridia bacterium]|nr:ribonuclease D [Clostridia bacterium]
MCTVTRIHLKTDTADRESLLRFCLDGEQQYVAIGWIGAYETDPEIKNYEDYYYAVKEHYKARVNHVLNVFWYAKEGDLFWTRDSAGMYWICKATGSAQPKLIPEFDIGAVVPVKAYKYGLDVPGQIKASFSRPRGGTCEDLTDEAIVEFSKKAYNELSGKETYTIKSINADLLNALPALDLEELVISYIQIKENYYLLSNSIANRSTTPTIECTFIGRDPKDPKKAVVQVKGGTSKELNAPDFKPYEDAGYVVFLYAPHINNQELLKNCRVITREQLLSFYNEYKPVLPDSITKWENII